MAQERTNFSFDSFVHRIRNGMAEVHFFALCAGLKLINHFINRREDFLLRVVTNYPLFFVLNVVYIPIINGSLNLLHF